MPKPLELCRIINFEMISTRSSRKLRPSLKDVLEENGMFYGGPISRADVRTRIALQRQDMRPFTKLGDTLPDMDRWEECIA